MSVRVRYAPSPTGMQHIGGIRTALFNYFFARSQKGSFILRIEDTDQERYHPEALQDLYDSLEWLGIEWDEGPGKDGAFGPYVQSQRTRIYQAHAKQLVEMGKAYYCFCTAERLDEIRETQQKSNDSIQGYDRHCRELSSQKCSELLANKTSAVIRLKGPLQGEVAVSDYLLGKVVRKARDISPDPVLLKSDGFPTYHLANVVDDHLMEITHILRAQEWLPSTPVHVLIYQAFGWNIPEYCHLPMVVGEDGKKLSKRHGAAALREFRSRGYLPAGIINYISLLGWSYDDRREFFSKQELEQLFSLEKLNKAPGVFDYKKLAWFNGHYIRELDDEQLGEKIISVLEANKIIESPPGRHEQEKVMSIVPLIKERLTVLHDAVDVTRFLFQEITEYDPSEGIPKKMSASETIEILKHVKDLLQEFDKRDDQENEELFRAKAQELDIKLGSLLTPLRVAVTGSKVSPPLFESIRLLGVEKAVQRVAGFILVLEDEN